ncbi:MAG: hypothetical protein BGO90_14290 [Legionella sp. 40-6]|nr:MAG: hypothetical protein BGO90_14290 [Legionella sp. 40-6]
MNISTSIKKANRLLIKKANQLLKKHNITHAYASFLMELYRQDGMTQAELHKRIGIEQPTAVRTLDRMERDGFIQREQMLEDRRAVRIKLTNKGKGYQKILQDCVQELNELALRGIDKQERALLIRLMNTLNSNLES